MFTHMFLSNVVSLMALFSAGQKLQIWLEKKKGMFDKMALDAGLSYHEKHTLAKMKRGN